MLSRLLLLLLFLLSIVLRVLWAHQTSNIFFLLLLFLLLNLIKFSWLHWWSVLNLSIVASNHIFTRITSNYTVGLVVLVYSRIRYAWSSTYTGLSAEVWSLLASTECIIRIVRLLLATEASFFSFFFNLKFLFFKFFFTVFFCDLELESVFHFLLLHFSFV
jgi:hypothetical protein